MAAGALTLLGAGNTAGRALMGGISDKLGRKQTLILCYALQGVVLFGFLGVSKVWMLYIVTGLLGLCYGGYAAVFAPLVGEFFGLAHSGKLIGIYMTVGVFSGVLGPALAGWLFDVTGTYEVAFIIAGALALAAVALVLVSKPAYRSSS